MKFNYFLCFTLEDQPFALRIEQVECVIRAVEITLLPDVPELVLGILNFHGKMILVVNLRKRLGLAPKDLEPDDFIIIAKTSTQTLGMVVNQLDGVIQYPEQDITASEQLFSGSKYIEGLIRLPDGVRLIQDIENFPEQFLTSEEEKILAKDLDSATNKAKNGL